MKENLTEVQKEQIKYHVTTKTNLMDWLVYTLITMIIVTPFFVENWSWLLLLKQFSISLVIGFICGIFNHIIRQLVFIKTILIKTNKKS